MNSVIQFVERGQTEMQIKPALHIGPSESDKVSE